MTTLAVRLSEIDVCFFCFIHNNIYRPLVILTKHRFLLILNFVQVSQLILCINGLISSMNNSNVNSTQYYCLFYENKFCTRKTVLSVSTTLEDCLNLCEHMVITH